MMSCTTNSSESAKSLMTFTPLVCPYLCTGKGWLDEEELTEHGGISEELCVIVYNCMHAQAVAGGLPVSSSVSKRED